MREGDSCIDLSEDVVVGLQPRDPILNSDRLDFDMRDVCTHRLSLLADDVLVQRGADGALPSDPQLDLAPGPTRLGLSYHLLPDHHFSITVDPAHPGPSGLVQVLNPSQRTYPKPDPMPTIFLTFDEVVVDCSGSMVGTGR